jgi:hypothetical protein
MQVAIVFQHYNNRMSTFTNGNRGAVDARRAIELADLLHQPRNTIIYFGADGVDDAYRTSLKRAGKPWDRDEYVDPFIEKYVGRYFKQVGRAFSQDGRYAVGGYGSGRVCEFLLANRLVSKCWLAAATSWPGYSSFLESDKWSLKQFPTTSDCFGLSVDLNIGKKQFGQWTP